MKTDQTICPLSKRKHDRNTLVLRFNLTKREMSVGCWCNPQQVVIRVPLEIMHGPACYCWNCTEQDLREMYS